MKKILLMIVTLSTFVSLPARAAESLEKILDNYISYITHEKNLSDFTEEEQKYIKMTSEKLSNVLAKKTRRDCISRVDQKATKARALSQGLEVFENCIARDNVRESCFREFDSLKEFYFEFKSVADDVKDDCE